MIENNSAALHFKGLVEAERHFQEQVDKSCLLLTYTHIQMHSL